MKPTDNSPSYKWLYLPIDIKTRELHGKALLAAYAVKQGYRVVIGKKSSVAALMNKFPAGAFLGFGAHENFVEKYKELKTQGHTVVSMDEEGLLTFSEEMFQRFRLSFKTIPYVDCAIAWGEHHASMMRDFCTKNNLSLNISVCGNPRLDVLSEKFREILEDDVLSIKKRHGKFFLFVSSFASCNHHKGKDAYTQDLIKKKIIQTEEDLAFYQRYFDLKKKNFDFFCEMIPYVAQKYPDYKVIIRPHPSENRKIWENIGKECPNIEICYEGSIYPWMIASEAILHHFCTTAVEAYVCDIPSIALRAEKDETIEIPLPYNCSYSAENPEELMSAIHDILFSSSQKLGAIRKRNKEYYSHYIFGIKSGCSCTEIMKSIDSVLSPSDCSKTKLTWLVITENILGGLRSVIQRGKDSYLEQKFSSLHTKEIQSILAKIGATNSALGDVKVMPLNRSTCLLYK